MIGELEARELHGSIFAALAGDLTQLPRALDIAADLLAVHLPAWQWESAELGPTLQAWREDECAPLLAG